MLAAEHAKEIRQLKAAQASELEAAMKRVEEAEAEAKKAREEAEREKKLKDAADAAARWQVQQIRKSVVEEHEQKLLRVTESHEESISGLQAIGLRLRNLLIRM